MDYNLLWFGIYGFLGLIGGYLLRWIAPEEIRPGKRFFVGSKALFAWLMVGLFLLFGLPFIGIWHFLLILFGLICGFLFRGIYFVLGLGIGFATGNFLIGFATLVFVFGMFEGTLKCKWHSFFLHLISYFLPVVLLLFYDVRSIVNDWYVWSFVAGYLVIYGYKVMRKCSI